VKEDAVVEYIFRVSATKKEHEYFKQKFLDIKDNLDVENNSNAIEIEHFRRGLIQRDFNGGLTPEKTINPDEVLSGVKVG